MTAKLLRGVWALLPLLACALFVVCYALAAALYPGGSQADAKSEGFSWLHNYWCNLLWTTGINGQPNPGRPFAIAGMVWLAVAFVSAGVLAAKAFIDRKAARRAVYATVALSMLPLIFLNTTYHDPLLMTTAFFGLMAMAIVYSALYRRRRLGLFWLGVFNVLLIGLNNYIYYLAPSLYWLPLVQKITFASYLLWMGLLSLLLYKTQNSTARNF